MEICIENREELIEKLRQESPEYKELERAHLEYEKQLKELDQVRHPTAEEEAEIIRVKKLKLHGKDRMEALIEAYKKKITGQTK